MSLAAPAPIALFAYNRPEHLRRTLDALRANIGASETEIFAFCDAPREQQDEALVQDVRKICRSIDGFKQVHVREASQNKGLAKSVIEGISEVIHRAGSVVVIEDDLVTAPAFLSFTNSALLAYESNPRVFSITGYLFPIAMPEDLTDAAFLGYRCSSWGWATWRNRWEKADWNIADFAQFSANPKDQETFNRGGPDLSRMLSKQMANQVDSWAIRWCYAHHRNNSYCLYPTRSLVANIGNDGSGIHCKPTDKYDVELDMRNTLPPLPTTPQLHEKTNEQLRAFFAPQHSQAI